MDHVLLDCEAELKFFFLIFGVSWVMLASKIQFIFLVFCMPPKRLGECHPFGQCGACREEGIKGLEDVQRGTQTFLRFLAFGLWMIFVFHHFDHIYVVGVFPLCTMLQRKRR